jgi:hypothetical protein
MPAFTRYFDGKKFLWDGRTYETIEGTEKAEQDYQKSSFETQLVQEEGKCLLYTRKVVKEVIVA